MSKPTIDTLVEDIYGLFQDGKEVVPSEELLDEFAKNVREVMEVRFDRARNSRKPYLRMSNSGRPDRQLWFDINDSEDSEPLQPHTYIKFLYGDLIEQMLLFLCKLAGHEVTHEQQEVELDGVKGHIDAIIDGVVVDVKSASTYSFARFASGALLDNDPFGYVGQLSNYVTVLTPGQKGAFLVADKTLGHITLAEIEPEVIQEYDAAKRIAHAKEVVSLPEPPEKKCYDPVPDGKSGNMKLDTGCSYCPHKAKCWPDLRTFFYSTGPKYLTEVKKEPRVPELGVGHFGPVKTE